MLKDMKQCGVNEQEHNPWLFPIVFILKKNGNFCLDYRKLNDVTKKGCFPPPRINNTQDTLAGARWFFNLDLKSDYWQVALLPNDEEKIAFSTGPELWHSHALWPL
jgi:hypothetical protein